MPRRTFADFDALDALLRDQERVATHRQLTSLGLPTSTICDWIQPRGRWQRLLPGVILAHRGTPTRRERRLAALAYAGDDAILTGSTALQVYGVRAVQPGTTEHVLVPHTCHRDSHSFIVIERTRRLPDAVVIQRQRVAPIARAVVDACRRIDDLDQVRGIVAEVVQTRRCLPDDIVVEVRKAARQRTALSRSVLREISEGIRSVAEAQARAALARNGVPQPEWNVSLYDEDGEFLGDPDGYYEDVAVAIQIDSMEWHLSPSGYKRTQRRSRRYVTRGVLTLEIAPSDVLNDPLAFCREVEELRRQGANRPVPRLIVRRRGEAA
jgi:hypothetical protein